MNRLDRLFGILIHLRAGSTISASQLAARLEVSQRTVYRDVEALSALGIPVYAERGREGGIRLLEGFFLPPIMFTPQEAISLVIALTLLHSLRAKAYGSALETAQAKLLAAVSDRLRHILADAPRIVGFEQVPADIFHAERSEEDVHSESAADSDSAEREGALATLFMEALLEERSVRISYLTPYSRPKQERTYHAAPLGMFWDRGHWYLVGVVLNGDVSRRLWRTDRIVTLQADAPISEVAASFDIRGLLGREWLGAAMALWREQAPVTIRITAEQAARLKRDWYYRHAAFETDSSGAVHLTLGEDDPQVVIELVRWLGPGAELISPETWRSMIRSDLMQMLECYYDKEI